MGGLFWLLEFPQIGMLNSWITQAETMLAFRNTPAEALWKALRPEGAGAEKRPWLMVAARRADAIGGHQLRETFISLSHSALVERDAMVDR